MNQNRLLLACCIDGGRLSQYDLDFFAALVFVGRLLCIQHSAVGVVSTRKNRTI